MSNEQVVIDKLYSKYIENGYVTEDDIFDLCTEYDLPFHRIDYVCDRIISKGVLVSNDSPVKTDADDEVSDYAQTDYEVIFQRAIYLYPNMKPAIDYIRTITPPQKGETKRLIAQVRSGNKFARERIIKMYMRMALKIAMQYDERTAIPAEDLFSVACIALIKAVDGYDEDNNAYFTSYASMWMSRYIERYIIDKAAVIRIPVYQIEKMDAIEVDSLDEIMENDEDFDLIDEVDIYDISESHELALLLKRSLRTLSEKEEHIIKLRFGLEDGNEYTLEDIGESFNVTRERIRQLESTALRRMRHPTRARIIREFY